MKQMQHVRGVRVLQYTVFVGQSRILIRIQNFENIANIILPSFSHRNEPRATPFGAVDSPMIAMKEMNSTVVHLLALRTFV